MAGSSLSLGIASTVVALAIGLSAVGAAAVFGQRLSGAADAAALAAADAASGAVSGVPCERAVELAAAFGASIEACEVEGLIATVTVAAAFGRIPVRASARAGPPP
jgi:secretion/DNA translocation related TadE-like protein